MQRASIQGQTAARAAGIDYEYGTWADIIRDVAKVSSSRKFHETAFGIK